ncbi:hypothetical protein GCM10010403_23600 [Glycomyces rutgersensis]|uniref:Uncharacterized protein n=1 Tax=Glycomyces rutgersensis TaxID=58115 RepID=A0ABP5SH44_9ACTN
MLFQAAEFRAVEVLGLMATGYPVAGGLTRSRVRRSAGGGRRPIESTLLTGCTYLSVRYRLRLRYLLLHYRLRFRCLPLRYTLCFRYLPLRYRYWPVFDTVSMLRPESGPLPETSVRM